MISVWTIRGAGGRLLRAEVVPGPPDKAYDPKHENRNDWRTMAAAEEIAAALGHDYVATDAGPHVSPRYDVVRLPFLGDPVSYAFNGDSYPCGKIVRISKGPEYRRIEAHEDATVGNPTPRKHVFWRRGRTGSWVKDGTWHLTAGHVSRRNPEF
jgi:hypothetical protein